MRVPRPVPSPRTCPGTVWLVLCIMLLAALAPSMARAGAWARAGAAIEICTFDGGVQWITLPAQDDSAKQEAPKPLAIPSLDHCPFCLQATDRDAAPPPHQPYLFLDSGGNQARPVWQAFFYASRIQHSPRARGPPAML